MTTQQPEALRLAEILEGDYCPDWFYETGVDEVSAELRSQHARITELESQLAQRFDAADVATAAQAVVDRWDTPLWKDVPATAEYIGRLRAALAAGQATAAKAVVPSGWNLVPTEPTQAMLDAVVTSMDDFLLGKEAEKQYREDWAAMLAAAPAQPAAQQGAAYAATPTSNYAGRVYEEGFLIGTCPLYTADQLRAFADATYALRASHGQAPAQPEVPPDQMIAECGIKASRMMARDLTRFDAACEVMDYLKKEVRAPYYYLHRMSIVLHGNTEGTEASRAPENSEPTTSPQADSVLEDAARYQWLFGARTKEQVENFSDTVMNPLPQDDVLSMLQCFFRHKAGVDAVVDAARKQGEKQ